MKIPDRYKLVPELEDDFLDFITSVYTDEAEECKSLDYLCKDKVDKLKARLLP